MNNKELLNEIIKLKNTIKDLYKQIYYLEDRDEFLLELESFGINHSDIYYSVIDSLNYKHKNRLINYNDNEYIGIDISIIKFIEKTKKDNKILMKYFGSFKLNNEIADEIIHNFNLRSAYPIENVPEKIILFKKEIINNEIKYVSYIGNNTIISDTDEIQDFFEGNEILNEEVKNGYIFYFNKKIYTLDANESGIKNISYNSYNIKENDIVSIDINLEIIDSIKYIKEEKIIK